MPDSHSMGPLQDLVPHAAAEWATSDLDLRTPAGVCARWLEVVTAAGSPSLVLKLENGQTRTYDATNAGMASGWKTAHGLRIKSIGQATANIAAVLVGY